MGRARGGGGGRGAARGAGARRPVAGRRARAGGAGCAVRRLRGLGRRSSSCCARATGTSWSPGSRAGMQALGTVRLPYASADPWPRIVLELLGTELLIFAGLLTFWPRIDPVYDARAPLAVPDRGYPFVALGVLIIVVASPVVSLGGPESLLLGLLLAALSVVLPVVGAAPAAARPRGRRAAGDRAGRCAAAGGDGRPRRAVVRLPLVRREPRARRSGALLVEAGVRADRLAARRQRGDARHVDGAAVLEGPQPRRVRRHVVDRSATSPRTNPRGDEPFEADVPSRTGSCARLGRSTVDFSIRRVRTTEVFGAGTTIRVEDASRAYAAGTVTGHLGRAERTAPRRLLHGRGPSPAAVRRRARRTPHQALRERQDGERKLVIPFRPDVLAPVSVIGRRADRPSEAEVNFAPFDGEGLAVASYPEFNRAEFNLDEGDGAVGVRAHVGAVAATAGGHRATRWTTSAPSTSTSTGRSSATSSAPRSRRPGVAPLDFFINDSHQGYCQHFAGAMALLLRMGGLPARVATGFTPGGYSERHKAWIVRDTDAHAWVEVWFDEYGWVTLDPTPDATPARSQVAALAAPPSSTPLVPDRGPGADRRGGRQPNPARVRPELQVGASDDRRQRRRLGRDRVAALVRSRGARRRRAARACCCSSAGRAARPRWTARSRRSRPRCAASAGRSRPARRSASSRAGSARTRRRSRRTSGRSPPAATGWTGSRRHATGRRALRRALAQGLGFFGAAPGVVGDAAALRAACREPRSRVFEVETSVRG